MNKLEVAIKGLLKPFTRKLKKNKLKANSTKYYWGTASSSMGGAISPMMALEFSSENGKLANMIRI
jgi:hypothetical protein